MLIFYMSFIDDEKDKSKFEISISSKCLLEANNPDVLTTFLVSIIDKSTLSKSQS